MLTEQIEAEQALRHLNETLEQRVETEAQERARIWNVSQDLLVVADMEGQFIAVNPAWNATLGWSEADLLNKTFEWLVHPDDIAEIAGAIVLASPTAAIHCISKIVSATSKALIAGCRGKPSPKRAKSMLSPGTLPILRIRQINCGFRAGNSRR